MGHFLRGWGRSCQYVLHAHSQNLFTIKIPVEQPVARYERSDLYLFSGWKEKEQSADRPSP
jgi:hypothetical protein